MMLQNKNLILLIITVLFLHFAACSQSPDEVELEEEKLIHAEIDSLTQPRVLEKDMESVDSLLKKKAYQYSYFNDLDSFEDSIQSLYSHIMKKNPEVKLDYSPFRYAMIGYYSLRQDNRLNDKNLVSIIDFTKSSCDKRFYTVDLDELDVIFYSLVSHGRNTGEDMATKFSNERSSNSSSLGFYVTGNVYTGKNGYSMRLHGDEPEWNDRMMKRAVVMHGASYVSEDFVKKYGRLGRSYGCPALPVGLNQEVINTIKDKTVIFAYYTDNKYLNTSKYLDVDKLINKSQNETGR